MHLVLLSVTTVIFSGVADYFSLSKTSSKLTEALKLNDETSLFVKCIFSLPLIPS